MFVTLVRILLSLALLLLSADIIRHDLRALLVPARSVLALTVLAILHGILFPLPGLGPGDALTGAVLGLALGTLTRLYMILRTGVPAFGGADLALIGAAGGSLGPLLLGPWLLCAIMLALVLALLPGRFGLRRLDIDGQTLSGLPFCPAILISAAAFRLLGESGLITGIGNSLSIPA